MPTSPTNTIATAPRPRSITPPAALTAAPLSTPFPFPTSSPTVLLRPLPWPHPLPTCRVVPARHHPRPFPWYALQVDVRRRPQPQPQRPSVWHLSGIVELTTRRRRFSTSGAVESTTHSHGVSLSDASSLFFVSVAVLPPWSPPSATCHTPNIKPISPRKRHVLRQPSVLSVRVPLPLTPVHRRSMG